METYKKQKNRNQL